MTFTATETMISAAANELENGTNTFVGVGLPMLACNLAKKTHAPRLQMIYESGVIGAPASRNGTPSSVGAPDLVSDAISVIPMFEGFSTYLQGSEIDVGFLGGAQIDRAGNINSSVIGSYEDPSVRLPGSGGACEIAENAKETYVIMPHEKRRFPEEVDFVTSAGAKNQARMNTGRAEPRGPTAVFTDKAILRFDENNELYVVSIHPDSSRDDIDANTAWDIPFADNVSQTPPPTEHQLEVLRSELDPTGEYIE